VTTDLEPRNIVGIMGGHDMPRTDDMYRAAAELGASLTLAGRTVLTGGGPGAMEAANLGAYLSSWPASLDEALTIMKLAPSFRPSIDAWAAGAFEVRDRWPISGAGRSLSIPTWFYGHEPTNVFASEIAKYFSNALREDSLLSRCRGGVVYLPGQAGTVQEIFQAVTENFYAADATLVAPLILVGRHYWIQTYPAWALLQRLGADRPMGESIHCVDSVKEAADLLTG
ncbi:MAG TPA: Rossmann fold nucleotide-binding protein, partial [Propionibacteriaceae bacterium]|nr:Rossmann fold nucleotide-binding protein [Propionibacteriaceae bacterium]